MIGVIRFIIDDRKIPDQVFTLQDINKIWLVVFPSFTSRGQQGMFGHVNSSNIQPDLALLLQRGRP